MDFTTRCVHADESAIASLEEPTVRHRKVLHHSVVPVPIYSRLSSLHREEPAASLMERLHCRSLSLSTPTCSRRVHQLRGSVLRVPHVHDAHQIVVDANATDDRLLPSVRHQRHRLLREEEVVLSIIPRPLSHRTVAIPQTLLWRLVREGPFDVAHGEESFRKHLQRYVEDATSHFMLAMREKGRANGSRESAFSNQGGTVAEHVEDGGFEKDVGVDVSVILCVEESFCFVEHGGDGRKTKWIHASCEGEESSTRSWRRGVWWSWRRGCGERRCL